MIILGNTSKSYHTSSSNICSRYQSPGTQYGQFRREGGSFSRGDGGGR